MKHITNDSITLTNNNAQQFITIAKGVLNPDPYTNANNVRAGSIIGDVHFLADIVIEGGSPTNNPQLDIYAWFNVNQAQTQPVAGAENASHLKNQIFWMEQIQLDHVTGTAPWVNKIRIQLKIPKWARQINDGDAIEIVYKWTGMGASVAVDHKFKSIYKEYFP